MNDLPVLFGVALPGHFALGILGCALIWASRIVFERREGTWNNSVRKLMIIAGMLMTSTSLLAIFGVQACFLFAIFGVAVLAYQLRQARGHGESLAILIATSFEQNISTETVVESYARDNNHSFGYRVDRLARLLKLGYPIPYAIRATVGRYLPGFYIASCFGWATDTLAESIQTAKAKDDMDHTRFRIFGRLFYIYILVVFLLFCSSFIGGFIVPQTQKMWEEFSGRTSSSSIVEIFAPFLDIHPIYFGMIAFIGLIFLTCFSLALAGVNFRWMDFLTFFRRINFANDRTQALRLLGIAMRNQKSLDEYLEAIRFAFPQNSVMRKRAIAVQAEIKTGTHWCDALHRFKILDFRDHMILRSAERVGNLDWAISEVANNQARRSLKRWEWIVSLLTYLTIFVVGFFVLSTGVYLFHTMTTFVEIGAEPIGPEGVN